MQVEPYSQIASINLQTGDCLALAPIGKPIDPLPEPIEPKYDIKKLIVKEKLEK